MSFGPYAYSNSGSVCRSVAPDHLPEPGEAVFPDLATDDQLEAAFPGHLATKRREEANTAILAQIAELEASVTPERLRQAALGDAGRQWLQGVDDQITALRSNLLK